MLQNDYPFIHLIRSNVNLGFAGGNNIGIDASSGKYIMLINNDTIILEDHFDILLSRFESHPEIGAISPKILFSTPVGTIQFAGYTKLTPITLRNSLVGYLEKDGEAFNCAKQTPYCHGAAMIVRREVIENVGKMTEKYFLYYEELDWSTAIARKGYQLWFDPSQIIIHKESCSVGVESPLKTYYMTRNRLLFAFRNLNYVERILSISYQMLIAIPKSVLKYLLNGKRQNAKAAIKGEFDFFNIKGKRL